MIATCPAAPAEVVNALVPVRSGRQPDFNANAGRRRRRTCRARIAGADLKLDEAQVVARGRRRAGRRTRKEQRVTLLERLDEQDGRVRVRLERGFHRVIACECRGSGCRSGCGRRRVVAAAGLQRNGGEERGERRRAGTGRSDRAPRISTRKVRTFEMRRRRAAREVGRHVVSCAPVKTGEML